jgi:hypothetical protein
MDHHRLTRCRAIETCTEGVRAFFPLGHRTWARRTAGPTERIALTEYEPAVPAAKSNHSSARYVVAVEITVEAWTADEAAHVVRGFLSNVFARSEYQMGNVHGPNIEPPDDDTWHRALYCAGALG